MQLMHTGKSTSPRSPSSNLSQKIEVLDHDSLVVVGGTPDSSSQSSPSNSRPTSARLSGSSGRASRPLSASSHKSYSTPALEKRDLQRLEVHQKRKERLHRNIFSDSIIEKELGKLAETNLKDDFAKEFRQHIQKVGGRFSRYSFRRTAVSPDRVVPVISDLPPPRPSFSPINSHSNIIGLQPESSQDDVAEPEIIEPSSLLHPAARSVDIKSISLYSGTKVQTGLATQRPSSAASHISSVSTLGKESPFVPELHSAISRPLSAGYTISCPDAVNLSSRLLLSGSGLCRRIVQMSGHGKTARSAYVTAGTYCPFLYRNLSHIHFSSQWCFSNQRSIFFSGRGQSYFFRSSYPSSNRFGNCLHHLEHCSFIIQISRYGYQRFEYRGQCCHFSSPLMG
jgi:hypothetical protein